MSLARGIKRVALVAVILTGFSATVAAVPVDQPNVGTFNWVRSLSESGRTFYLRDSVLRSLPLDYRRALINSIPNGSGRSAFWRAAFAAYREGHTLSEQQLAALARAIEQATPEALDGSSRSREGSPKIVAGLAEAFGPSATDDILYKSGTVADGSGLPSRERLLSEWRRLKARLVTVSGVRKNRVTCDCAFAGTCETNQFCDRNATCDKVPPPDNGCDPLNLLWCDGMCTPIPSPEIDSRQGS